MTKKLNKLKKLLKGKIIDLYGKKYVLESFEAFEKCHYPCIIVNSMNSWPALKLWQAPYIRLMELIPPEYKIRVALSYNTFSGVSAEYADVSLYEFLTLSTFDNINCYMAQCPLMKQNGIADEFGISLLKDIRLPMPNILPTHALQLNLWFNIKPVVSEFHYDSYQSLLCVIHGSKTVELIPPSKLVKAYTLDTEAYNHAQDAKAGEFAVTLHKGQILFIPEGWWHKVTSTHDTIAVSVVWEGVDQQILHNQINGEIDYFVARNAIKRLSVKYVDRIIQKIATRKPINQNSLNHMQSGDSELIKELFQEFGVIPVLYNSPVSTIRKILFKLKKYGGLFKFLKSLTLEEGYFITKKLDECDKLPNNELANDFFDGSEKFAKMKEILMRYKTLMLRKGLNYIIKKLI